MIVLISFGGCAESSDNASQEQDAIQEYDKDWVVHATQEDLADDRIAVMSGTPQDSDVRKFIPEADIYYFEKYADEAIALENDKIDSFICAEGNFRFMQEDHMTLRPSDFVYATYKARAIFPQTEKGEYMREQMNQYIKEDLTEERIKEIEEKWLVPGAKEGVDLPTEGENGIIYVGTSTAIKPYSYILDQKNAGTEMEVLKGFCEKYGYGVKVDDANFTSMISGTATSKYDMCLSMITYTEERAQKVLFSDPYSGYDMIAIVEAEDYGIDVEDTAENTSLIETIKKGFIRTFIEEHRYNIIASGLLVTLAITVFGFILANVLGAVFCAMAMSRKRALRVIADIYSRIMQGTPILVILMILYYVIFKGSTFSGIFVSVIGFGITSGAYLAQIFQGGISGVDKGQTEAALSLGMKPAKAFTGIVLPQAIRIMLPGYFSHLITLMKGTSIVGYIAVVDLTKASDIIRTATFEAFFTLVSTAIIYFAISCILLSILKAIQKSLMPKRETEDKEVK